MFAVPGWKVSADSLAAQAPTRTATDAQAATSNSKKRKREQPEQRLSAQDLDRLWNNHFGTPSGKSKTAGKKKSKNGRTEEVVNGRKSEHITTPEGSSKNKLPVNGLAGVEKDSGRSKKRKKAQQKPNDHDSSLPEDPGEQLSRKASATSSGDQGNKSLKRAENSQVSKHVGQTSDGSPQTSSLVPPQPPPPPASAHLTPLQAKMRDKLTSARFRHLNQTLYTTSSSDAFQLFSTSPELFGEYHAGFSQQVKDSWPQNPVDFYIQEIKERGKLQEKGDGQGINRLPLPRRKTGRCTIADLGCGDAPLARGCQSQVKALQLKFHNYDLHAPNSFVIKADMANLPLRDGEADIAVFCLSLMGTNWIDFIEEAWRVLRGDGKGEVWVAEVKSRFGRVKPKVVENSVGKKKKVKAPKKESAGALEEAGPINGVELFAQHAQSPDPGEDTTDISAFLDVFLRRGFSLREGSVDRSNKMFISAVFTKAGIPTAGKYKGWKWTGREYEKGTARHSGRMTFLDSHEDEVSPEDEARVLKPCVYKSR